jgi:hypothetical protein
MEGLRTTRVRDRPDAPPRAPAPLPPMEQLLRLQHSAGNRATADLVARLRTPSGPVRQRTTADAELYRIANNLPELDSPLDTLVNWANYLRALKAKRNKHLKPLTAELVKGLPPELAQYVRDRLADPHGDFVPVDEVSDDEEADEESENDDDGEDDARMDVDVDSRALPDDEDSGEDGSYVPRVPVPAPAPSRKRKAKEFDEENETDFTFRGDTGSKRHGSVKGTLETIRLVSGKTIQRPTNLRGMVEPRATTGRRPAPEPPSYKVGMKLKEVGTKPSKNTGMVDAQKGHIMALELGGPDLPWNIVPQWANWQANGEWRRAEREVLELAKEAQTRGRRIEFNTDVLYKRYKRLETASERGLVVPVGFHMMVREVDPDGTKPGPWVTVFEGEQHQDETDFKVSGRALEKIDPMELEPKS